MTPRPRRPIELPEGGAKEQEIPWVLAANVLVHESTRVAFLEDELDLIPSCGKELRF